MTTLKNSGKLEQMLQRSTETGWINRNLRRRGRLNGAGANV